MSLLPEVKDEHARWVLRYAVDRGPVDMLDRYFVEAFAEKFGVATKTMVLGAPKCRKLSEVLRALHFLRYLDRYPQGIDGMSGMGFPKWVYRYRPTAAGRGRLGLLEAAGK